MCTFRNYTIKCHLAAGSNVRYSNFHGCLAWSEIILRRAMAMEQAVVIMDGGSFVRMRQKLWNCLMDPTIKVFSVLGWEGVGSSMITRQVVDELSKLQQQGDEQGKKLEPIVSSIISYGLKI